MKPEIESSTRVISFRPCFLAIEKIETGLESVISEAFSKVRIDLPTE